MFKMKDAVYKVLDEYNFCENHSSTGYRPITLHWNNKAKLFFDAK